MTKIRSSNYACSLSPTGTLLDLYSCQLCLFILSRDSRRNFGLDIEFIDNVQVVTTNNYNTIANLHRLYKITLSFPARSVFTSCCLIKVSYNCYSTASWLKSTFNGGCLPTANSSSHNHVATDSHSVSLGVELHLGLITRY
jgi:hypothetical protein